MDINLSMLLDRPPHVQGRLCNVPPLSESDFEQSTGSKKTETFGENLNEANIFVINAVQLARTVDRFFTIKFDQDSGHSQDICLEQISLWSSSPEFNSFSTNSSTWAILTQLLYQEYRLVLHRSNPRFSLNTGPGTPTFEICTEISHMLEILLANDLVYAAAASMYVPSILRLPNCPGLCAEAFLRIAPVLSVLSIYIVNIHRGASGVRMISEHRARFCMVILDKLQDRLPVVAAFYPIYESLLNRHFAGAQTQDGTKVPERPATGSRQLDDESNLGSTHPPGGLFDQVLQESMSTTFPFSFPFGNLFEDVFLSSPSQPTSYCEDDISFS
ncbi:Transcription factor [Penicillium lagena]|uniref:Transcription factor n=1 Tax=Penicillium lagena TaxID=94218 RepID=UPI0025413D3C|nr:Transcription factor [Penicillium lagena]KAJ5606204.1 Transcription factor [Penicillium lagena]